MAQVNEIALMMAIQAVDEKMWSLKEQVDKADPDDADLPYVEEELLSYSKAADDLRVAYENAIKPGDSLPPYEELVRKG